MCKHNEVYLPTEAGLVLLCISQVTSELEDAGKTPLVLILLVPRLRAREKGTDSVVDEKTEGQGI
jgi:hypothetical protein